ncbi:hypothetical protein CXF72_12150 [Psychromonas sp. MB-3u-54]|uniref:alpha/beta fold hydrolase n=1 Tax=Psychromonas sp. MB-3u-54 TaxID=2058319 RepID=UPI000C34D9E6|nr:alpha/beta hydrolase [Psychromonas sp. MB-3u-54]PKH02331.1 hypothetical protein CXF72_12150 [Psychromonas sp. MB-3u-54]
MKTPSVVLLSGTLCNEKMWNEIGNTIEHKYNAIALSIGHSSNWKQELDELIKFLPEKFILVGFSLGGIAALAMLSQYKERIIELVLISSTARLDPPESQQKRLKILSEVSADDNFLRIANEQISDVDRANLGNDKVNFITDMAQDISLTQFEHQTMLACSRKESLSLLAKCDLPIHLIYGTEDKACGEDKQIEIVEVCSSATLYPIHGGGHWLPLSHPNLVATLIKKITNSI